MQLRVARMDLNNLLDPYLPRCSFSPPTTPVLNFRASNGWPLTQPWWTRAPASACCRFGPDSRRFGATRPRRRSSMRPLVAGAKMKAASLPRRFRWIWIFFCNLVLGSRGDGGPGCGGIRKGRTSSKLSQIVVEPKLFCARERRVCECVVCALVGVKDCEIRPQKFSPTNALRHWLMMRSETPLDLLARSTKLKESLRLVFCKFSKKIKRVRLLSSSAATHTSLRRCARVPR